MTSIDSLRRLFVDYFKSKGHAHVASSSLVPRNDPTLMFTSAGMVQFKNVFTGQERRPYTRAVTAQKCVRAGGKHNDLDNVGYTARHHTFFEMLGNFSFGDYFKEEAIGFAWEFVTRDLHLSKDRLWITVHPQDDQARLLWRKIAGVPESRIVDIEDNLWAAGPVGPCGYCSELFYDQGEAVQGGPPGSAEQDGDRYLEFWNLVFMQFEQVDEATRVELPKPSIDTGMGLERITAILQGVHSNYDIDLFRALIKASEAATGVPAEGAQRASHRVIADHLRSTSFLVADGVLPANDGRGYVLRRIMRRAMRHAHLLGAKEPLLHRLVPTLVREMGETYPELPRAQALISETLYHEETRFRRTLERGLRLLDEATAGMAGGAVLGGDVAFRLYDTFGFPLDLTQDALKLRGVEVDTAAFEAAMERQKEEARRAWKGSGEAATEGIWFEVRERAGPTEFLGYVDGSAQGEVRALLSGGAVVDRIEAGAEGALVANQTPFYGEAGGQVGDTGVINGPDGAMFRVVDTVRRMGDLVVHLGRVEKGTFHNGDPIGLEIDQARRDAIRANHSATHLLHAALREVLGTHVTQKGSLVAPERLRFDISHNKALSAPELDLVEAMVNEQICRNSAVDTRLMGLDEARQTGAMALFGEKYGDEVRVVSMGEVEGGREGGQNGAWSIELCGGTHVERTGDIGILRIVTESATSAGVRRIEALTGEAARHYLAAQDARTRDVAALLRVRPDEVVDRVKALIETVRLQERQLANAKRTIALAGAVGDGDRAEAGRSEAGPRTIGRWRFLSRSVKGLNPRDLRGLVDEGKQQVGSGIVAVVGITEEGKVALAVGVTKDLVAAAPSAIELVRIGAEMLGGKGGGGRADFAQAGGTDASRADAALAAIVERLRS